MSLLTTSANLSATMPTASHAFPLQSELDALLGRLREKGVLAVCDVEDPGDEASLSRSYFLDMAMAEPKLLTSVGEALNESIARLREDGVELDYEIDTLRYHAIVAA